MDSNKAALVGPKAKDVFDKLPTSPGQRRFWGVHYIDTGTTRIYLNPNPPKNPVYYPQTIYLCIDSDDITSDNTNNNLKKYKKAISHDQLFRNLSGDTQFTLIPVIIGASKHEPAESNDKVTQFVNDYKKTYLGRDSRITVVGEPIYCETDNVSSLSDHITSRFGQAGEEETVDKAPSPDSHLGTTSPNPTSSSSFFAYAKQHPKSALASGTGIGIGVGLLLSAIVLAATSIVAWPVFIASIIMSAAIGILAGYGQQVLSDSTHKSTIR